MNTISSDYNEILKKFFHTEKIWEYSLKKIQIACVNFGHPENCFKSIHIAGTNGKGSVSKMIFQMLKESGKQVGIYTSPHLIDICERFETQKGQISKESFVKYAQRIVTYDGGLSYYERCVLLAFLYFRDEGCEFAVIEVGMGGRLDSTNIIHPVLSVITSIGYDHMEYLGNTLEEIAYEKGGIIKSNIPVILYDRNATLERMAKNQNSAIIFPKNRILETNMLGAHQLGNAGVAYEAGVYLGIDESTIREALTHVQHPGRMQYVSQNLLIDGAHNEDGLYALKEYIKKVKDDGTSFHEVVYCCSLKSGKSIELITKVFPDISSWNILQGRNPLLADAETLRGEISKLGKVATIVTSEEILNQSIAEKQKLFLVFGSLYLIGEFLH